ncbi:TetR/AcrR family transcriptional regulator [Mycolicibacterium porcinum]|uniref:TetR/AcrR family transcriptional regulator n=1 Tax=Mycolicibacterium porcinum TaxID=39693 RepID=UPI00197C1BA5|nr:TetR/AcrR family transcriptional regulator [Mycolicibacterium porcinum]
MIEGQSLRRDADLPASGVRERNRVRIVDAARELWAHNPDATMDDVSRAAGVVRRTLYGYFATREDLVIAVAERTAETVNSIAAEDRSESGATERLARIHLDLWSVGHHVGFLQIAAAQADANSIEALRRMRDTVAEVIADGQRTGEFSDHLPPQAIARLIESSAIGLHAAIAEENWHLDSRRVAAAALITAGVAPATALAVVETV